MSWCAARRLQLNADETQVMWIETHQDLTLTIGTETIKPVAVVWDLGVWLDNEPSLRQHMHVSPKLLARAFTS